MYVIVMMCLCIAHSPHVCAYYINSNTDEITHIAYCTGYRTERWTTAENDRGAAAQQNPKTSTR